MKKMYFIALCFFMLFITGNAAFAQMATISLPDLQGTTGNSLDIPITVSTDSSIGIAQFVVEYNSSVMTFINARLGVDAPSGISVANVNSDLPFSPTTPGTDDNVLVQISGGGSNAFSGNNQNIVILEFDVIGAEGSTSPLAFDQGTNKTYLSTLKLTDINGANLNFESGSVTIPSTNQPPDADANGPYSGETGESINFDGSASTDPDGSIASYAWDFGDGNSGSGVSPTHAYTSDGSFQVILTVTDDDGATDSDTTTATITLANQPPVADANGPYAGQVGDAINFDGSGSSDPDGSIASYAWDFGDGNSGTGVSPTHAYTSDGSFQRKLCLGLWRRKFWNRRQPNARLYIGWLLSGHPDCHRRRRRHRQRYHNSNHHFGKPAPCRRCQRALCRTSWRHNQLRRFWFIRS